MKIKRFEFFTGQALTALGGIAIFQGNTAVGILIIAFALLWQTGYFVGDKKEGSVA